jgi:hypothetical protein
VRWPNTGQAEELKDSNCGNSVTLPFAATTCLPHKMMISYYATTVDRESKQTFFYLFLFLSPFIDIRRATEPAGKRIHLHVSLFHFDNVILWMTAARNV